MPLPEADSVKYGVLMLKNGWKSEHDTELAAFRWQSPRMKTYYTTIANMPPEEAIDDCLEHRDVKFE